MDSISLAVAERERRGVGVSTVERVLRAGESAVEVHEGVQRIKAAALDRLHAKGLLTQRQYDAGDRYREDAYLSGAIWSSPAAFGADSPSFGPRAPAWLTSERVADARQRYRAARASLDGSTQALVIDAVCWAETTMTMADVGRIVLRIPSRRTAISVATRALRAGLDRLAVFYGV